MNDSFTVEKSLSFCRQFALEPVIFAVPRDDNLSALIEANGSEQVSGLIFPEDSQQYAEQFPEQKFSGRFLEQECSWEVPDVSASAIVYFGLKWEITYRMVVAANQRGCRRLVAFDGEKWAQEHVGLIFAKKVLRKLAVVCANLLDRMTAKAQHLAQKLYQYPTYSQYLTKGRAILARLEAPVAFIKGKIYLVCPWAGWLEPTKNSDESATLAPIFPPSKFNDKKIILLNSSLAWGGAERQIVTTLIGLKKRGYTDIELWCEHLTDRPDHDFYLADLEAEGIVIKVIDPLDISLNTEDEKRIADRIIHGISKFEPGQRQLILKLALDFYRARPTVIHAWQDSTSINAGYAASIVGVPKIVLGSRNMAPYHFAYFAGYMSSSYKALGARDNIEFTNNSNQGAKDYSNWLQFKPGKFSVIYNGIDTERFSNVSTREIKEYKDRHGIPDGCLLVGSVFRFYPEKDPILWIKTARELSRKFDNLHFLLVGTGPMMDEVSKLAGRWGILSRLHMPGTDKNPKIAMSSMDVFLLTSRQEGTPNVLIEAQLCGVPVVATDVGGVSDTVLNGETGWVEKRGSPKNLSASVGRLLIDPALRKRTSEKARLFSQERFDQNKMLDRTLALYGV